jgi:hypothetical protein
MKQINVTAKMSSAEKQAYYMCLAMKLGMALENLGYDTQKLVDDFDKLWIKNPKSPFKKKSEYE